MINFKNLSILIQIFKNKTMEKTLKLTDKQAKSLYKTAGSDLKELLEANFGSSFFSNKIIDRIQTFDDVLEEAGKTYEEVVPWKNPRTKAQKSQNALAKLQLISEVYNEEKELDFDDLNQYKYYNWFRKDNGKWVFFLVDYTFVVCLGPFGLFFYTEELAIDAKNKFESIYIDLLS